MNPPQNHLRISRKIADSWIITAISWDSIEWSFVEPHLVSQGRVNEFPASEVIVLDARLCSSATGQAIFFGEEILYDIFFFDWSVFMIQSEAEMDHFTWCQVPLFGGAPRSFRAAPAMPSFQRSGTASRSSFGPTCCYARVKRLVSFFDKTAGACLDSEDTVSNSIIMFGDPPLFLCLDCPLNQGLIGVWTWWFTMLGNSSERGLLLWFLVRVACFFQHLEGAWLYLQSHRLWSWLHPPMVPSASLRSVMLQSGRTNCAWIYWNFHVHVQMQRCYGSWYPIFLNYIWMYSNNINILFFWLHFVSILLNQRAFCLWAARQGGRWRARRRWS